MKKHKQVTADPIPRKFKEGDRVKPTAEAISLGWTKPGVVKWCGGCAISVQLDGNSPDLFTGFPVDWWETDEK